MKKILFILATLLSNILLAQSPDKISYQAVVRDNNNNLVTSHSVGIRISVLQGSISGTEVYSETQTTVTNANGLITIEIGGVGFGSINWANGPYFIKTEIDPTGGTIYSISGTSQLLSVPYALNAKTSQTALTADYNNLTNLPTLNLVNWNTAYGWGNHATAGYLTSFTESDPIFVASPANGITSTNVTNWNTAYGWGNHATAGYLTSYTETDPIFVASPANGITSTNVTNWNTAYGWGNHATAGYLTSYTETDPVFVASAANGITSTNVSNWNTAYGWGNHSGLYRPISYVPAWTDITSNPFTISSPSNNQLIKYNSTSGKWENFTPSYLSSYTETDPVWTTASANYYTKTNMQTSGSAQLHFNNLTNKPTTLSGYGITDAMTTSHAANGITSTNLTNWNSAYGWGDHSGLYRPIGYVPAWSDITSNPFSFTAPANNQLLKYNSTLGKWENWTPTYLTTEVDGSITNEIELPTQTGNSGKFLTTDGTTPSWGTLTKTTVGLGNVENTALSTWAGSSNITTLGTISGGTWQGSAIGATYIGNLPTSQITSGTFDNARINWAAPGNIGSTTASSGAFTSLSANNGLSVSNGTVNIKPSGSGGTNGQVLTTDGAGNATWKAVPSSSLSVSTQNANYTITTSDGLIVTNGGCTFTFPTAASAGAGKTIYIYSKVSTITLLPAVGNTIWDNSGNSHTNPGTMTSYSGMYISDGVNTWYEVTK